MRLHALTATAFGPFPRAVEVDFDEVCSAGLFLIHGATGAGKTSLLDAICFALFADVPGARTKRGLASDHASEGTRPSVRLDFSVGERRFRIERSPEFARPKKRGTGLTTVPAAVTLEERLDRRWQGLSTRHDEVADVLAQVLGMGLAQFAKVVVLPQGDVSAFLRATPEDRRALLERLFDISTFAGVEDWLAAERRRAAAEVEDLTTAISRDLDRLRDHLGTDTAPDWHALPVAALPAALTAQVGEVEAEVLTVLTAADGASHDLARASAALHAVRSAAATRERGLQALAARDIALAGTDEISALRGAVERAAAADAVSGHVAGLDSALDEESRSQAGLHAARRAAGLPDASDDASDDSDDDTSGGLDARVTALSELLHAADPVVSGLVHAAGEQESAESALVAARTAVDAAEESVAITAAERTHADEELAVAELARGELETLASGHDVAEGTFAAADRAVRIATEVDALGRARAADRWTLLAARDEVLAAQEAVIVVRQRRLDGMAGELAAALGEGEPCPVCGSAEHPAPAAVGDAVTPDEVESAEHTLSVVRSALTGLERLEATRSSRIETLREQLGDAAGHDLTELARLRDEAAASLAATSAARRGLRAAVESVAAGATRLHVAADRAAEANILLAAARATLTAAAATWDGHAGALSELRARHGACPCGAGSDDLGAADVHHTHSAMRDAVDRLLAAAARHRDAVARRRDRRTAAVEAAADRGFEDLDDVRAARLEPSVLDRYRARIADHGQTLAVTAAILDEDDIASALAGPPPDLAAAEDSESAARRTVREAQAAHTAAEARLLVLRSVQGPVCELVARLVRARDRSTTIKELADAATGVGGGNLYRMRLSSFVLAARLEQVVALANERLQRMNAGRYVLEHSDARVAGGARSGLDLRVLDQWTGRARETASLSGGESFMVSLALALGLADAVREESGGFDLGTLFVDEGFGSLDEESLEHVMGVLDGLREGGRAVGVVSHVPDLRSRISHQVVVEKTAAGSNVRVRTVA